MEDKLIICLKSYKLRYVKITSESLLEIIYDLWINKNLDDVLKLTHLFKNEKGMIPFYIGSFYHIVINNFELAMVYYNISIENGCSHAMDNLATSHKLINDVSLIVKSCTIAKLNNHDIGYGFEWLLKAKDMHNEILMFYIKFNDVENALKYLLHYKFECDEFTNDEYNIIVNFLHKIDEKYFMDIHGNLILKLLINSFKNNLDIMDLHFNYSIHSKGYEDAKKDFIDNLKNN